jgi:hypothetical protein
VFRLLKNSVDNCSNYRVRFWQIVEVGRQFDFLAIVKHLIFRFLVAILVVVERRVWHFNMCINELGSRRRVCCGFQCTADYFVVAAVRSVYLIFRKPLYFKWPSHQMEVQIFFKATDESLRGNQFCFQGEEIFLDKGWVLRQIKDRIIHQVISERV